MNFRQCGRLICYLHRRNISFNIQKCKTISLFGLHEATGRYRCVKQNTTVNQILYENTRRYSESPLMPLLDYNGIVNDTLENLADHFDQLADEGYFDDEYDCTLADGVLTAYLGVHGTYVLNKQTPNRQLWLSSPVSGPKRYDFEKNTWFYNHEPERCLHEVLTEELSEMLQTKVDFTQLIHGKKATQL